jgi:ferredoxin
MNLTVDILLNSCNRLSVKDTHVAAKQDEQLVKAIGKQLESMEIEGSFWMELHGTGELPEGLFDWLAAVVGVLWQQKEHVSLQQQQGLSGTDLPDATVISRVDPAQQDGAIKRHVIGQDQSAQHVFCKGCSSCERGADVFDVDDDNKRQQHSGGSSSSSNGGDNLADRSDRQPIVDCLVSCMLENVLRWQQEVVLQAAQALTVQQPQPQQQQEVTVQYQQQKDACAMDNAGSDMHGTKSCLASGAGGASRWTEGWCHIAADLQRVAWDAFQALDATLHIPQT